MKDLLRISDLTESDLHHLLDLSAGLKGHRVDPGAEMAGDVVSLWSTKPSTPTRLLFTAAAARLGATVVAVGPDQLPRGRVEDVEGIARAICCNAEVLVVCTSADDDVRRLAAAATVPVVNGLTDGHRPCQVLADLLTLREHFGALRGLRMTYLGNGENEARMGLRVAYVGDGNNLAHSLTEACALAGIDIALACPPGHGPDPEVVHRARLVAGRLGSRVEVTDDPRAAVEGADAVCTDVWLSSGDDEEEQAARRAVLAPYRVDAGLMALAGSDAVFLHGLPARRGDEVTAEVFNGPRSLVPAQVENRLHTATAVLTALRRGDLAGTTAAVRM